MVDKYSIQLVESHLYDTVTVKDKHCLKALTFLTLKSVLVSVKQWSQLS